MPTHRFLSLTQPGPARRAMSETTRPCFFSSPSPASASSHTRPPARTGGDTETGRAHAARGDQHTHTRPIDRGRCKAGEKQHRLALCLVSTCRKT